MKLLDNLQRRFGRYAVPHVTEGLIACQVLVYFLAMNRPEFVADIMLIPSKVLAGEVWRLATFVCQPPPISPIWAFFFWYVFYLMGTALEATWGAFRYNVYLLVGAVATAAVAFLTPDAAAPILFLQASVFLAFAYLYPDFEFLLFFLLPVKVKWLALIQWIGYGYLLLVGDGAQCLTILASIGNFLLFFWSDIALRMRSGQRRMSGQAAQIKQAAVPRHACAICGVTSLSDPTMSFRYCSKCAGGLCYCTEHLHNHEHAAMRPE